MVNKRVNDKQVSWEMVCCPGQNDHRVHGMDIGKTGRVNFLFIVYSFVIISLSG